MAADWYPDRLADRIPWHANFNTEAQATGTTYGLSAGQKAAIALDAANVAVIVNYLEAVSAFSEAVTGFKKHGFGRQHAAARGAPDSGPIGAGGRLRNRDRN